MLVIKRLVITLFILIGFNNLSFSNDNELNKYFENLKNTKNLLEAKELETKIWKTWLQHPNDNFLTDQLNYATNLMNRGRYQYALQIFTNIIHRDPKWSEAWNKRATLYFLIYEFDKSLKDIDKVLNIEPRHFGALSGRVQIYIELGEYEKALKDLLLIRDINPLGVNNDSIRKIESLIKGQDI